MQKHIITTIHEGKTEENKEKNSNGHSRRRNTNGCVAIHNEYYHNPKQTVETQVKTLSDNTILFSLNKHNEMKHQKIYQVISTCYSKIKKYEQSQVT